jgi:hypothetical protein
MAEPDRLRIATFRDGSQVLVTEWVTAEGVPIATVARRGHSGETWGPSVDLMDTQ